MARIAHGKKFIWRTTRISPLLFNIFLCDLFWIMCETDFASFADDNHPVLWEIV